MEKNRLVILSSIFLLLIIPGIASSDVLGEKLLVSDGFENNAQISALDKTDGTELQVFNDGTLEVLIGSMDFTSDGFLIGTAGDDQVDDDDEIPDGFYQVSFIIENGYANIRIPTVNEAFADIVCSGFSITPDQIAYCMNGEAGLVVLDFNNNTFEVLGDTGLDSIGNGVAVGPDGTIYLGTEIGLYTIDSITGAATLVVDWDHYTADEAEAVDEPNVDPLLTLGFTECIVNSMDFDSAGELYAMMLCDEEEPVLAKIGLNPSIILGPDENYDIVEQADLTLITLAEVDRSVEAEEKYGLIEFRFTDPITFSPFDFDFLFGNTYGVVISGFDDHFTATDEGGNFVGTTESAMIKICDNTTLTLDSAEISPECHNTTVEVFDGTVDAIFEADDEEIELLTATLVTGDIIVFDSAECSLTNNGVNDINVDFEDEITTIAPTEMFSCLKPTDHYFGYEIKDDHHDDEHDDEKGDHKESKDKKHKESKTIVNLVDSFAGDVDYELKKVKKLFNPVDVDDLGIGSEESHLVAYDLKKIKGEPKFEKIKNILVTNQFGDLIVDIKKPKLLLVPSNKTHDSTPDELEKVIINHFKCYDAKESKHTPKFEKTTVNLDDQFEGEINMKVEKPKTLCSPVNTDGAGIVNEENYLMCYDLKKIKGEPKFHKLSVFTNNQFGDEELEVKKQKQLCVPSIVILD